MKIEAFNKKWIIEVNEYYVRVNGETVATGYIPIGKSKETQEQVLSDMMSKDEELGLYDQPTDCDGTPLEYGDEMICVKEFTCSGGIDWKVGDKDYHYYKSDLAPFSEFTYSDLKNFKKVK